MSAPLTPEERADLEGISALWSGLPDGGLGYITSESSRALGRLLSEVDRLAARVSDLEAEQKKRDEHADEVATILDDTAMRHYEALESLRAAAQEARRAMDRWWPTVFYPPQPYEQAVKSAIDALCPPVPEDKKESAP